MTIVRRFIPFAVALVGIVGATPSMAERFENGVAVFTALDKVTARISELEVPLNETVEFGQLKVTPRVCYSRPPTERPKTTSFVEIDEVKLDGTADRLFTGWMLAESPGLNAVEHPVFDIWLAGCRAPKNDIASTTSADPQAAAAGTENGEGGEAIAPQPQPASSFQRRRIRR